MTSRNTNNDLFGPIGGAVVDLNTTVSNQSTIVYGGGAPVAAPVTCDAGDVHIEVYSDVIAYFTATAIDTWPAVAQTTVVVDPGLVPVITDTTLATGTNANVASALAVKTYVDSKTPAIPVVQTFTANGTYTPTAGMKYCVVRGVGGGGGGGGCGAGGATTMGMGAGGGAAAEAEVLYTAAQIGVSQAVTIGSAGIGGVGAAGGSAGGTSSLGALMSLAGGSGGGINGSQTGPHSIIGGAGGAPTISSGTVLRSKTGDAGAIGFGMYYATTNLMSASPSYGGSSMFGAGGTGVRLFNSGGAAQGGNGLVGSGSGAGGGGATSGGTGSVAGTGGNGVAGRLVVTEYF